MNRSRSCSFVGLVALCVAVLNPNSAYADTPPDADGPTKAPAAEVASPPVETTVINLTATTPQQPVVTPPPAPIIIPGEKTETRVEKTETRVEKTETRVERAVPVHGRVSLSCLVGFDSAAKCGVGLGLAFPTSWDRLQVEIIANMGVASTEGLAATATNKALPGKAGFAGLLRLELPFTVARGSQTAPDKSVTEVEFQLGPGVVGGIDAGDFTGWRDVTIGGEFFLRLNIGHKVLLSAAYMEGYNGRRSFPGLPPTWGDGRAILAELAIWAF